MSVKKFRRGETTYTCQSCRKLTRNTGGDEIASRLCLDCYDLAGIDNHLSDNGADDTREQYGREICRTLNRRPELAAAFPKLAELVERAPAAEPAKPVSSAEPELVEPYPPKPGLDRVIWRARRVPALLAALKVIELTPHIAAYLAANDPKALAQVRAAIAAATPPE